MKLLLVRHGHVDGISPERFRGRRDVPLSPQGAQQAHDVAQHIARRQRPVVVYTSPLRRCTETAAAIAAATAVDVQVLADLIDLDYGDWQWLTRDDVRRRWPDLLERWAMAPQLVRFPHGDSLQDLLARVSNVLRMLLERRAGDAVVVVGHESSNRALLLQLFDQPASSFWRFTQDPCGLSAIEIASNGARLIRLN